jgi:hypothetical protein
LIGPPLLSSGAARFWLTRWTGEFPSVVARPPGPARTTRLRPYSLVLESLVVIAVALCHRDIRRAVAGMRDFMQNCLRRAGITRLLR